MTADRSAAADTLRDELAEALWVQHYLATNPHLTDADAEDARKLWATWWPSARREWYAKVDAVLPVVLRYADAQVAAVRERIARAQAVGHIHENCPCRRDFVNIARGQP